MKKSSAEPTKEQVATQERLDTTRLVQKEYEQAQGLLKKGFFKAALKKFRWIFAHTESTSFFLSKKDILHLVKSYPPAKVAVTRWRNDKERLILEKKADGTLIVQWDILNLALGEKTRTFAVLKKLKDSGADDRLLHVMYDRIWEQLVRQRKYEELKTYLSYLGFFFLLHAVEFDSGLIFPTHCGLNAEQMRREAKRHTKYLLECGPKIYELALGLNRSNVASSFAKKMLAVETSDRVYASLIRAALRARSYSESFNKFNEAKLILGNRRVRQSSAAFKLIPKSQLAKLDSGTSAS